MTNDKTPLPNDLENLEARLLTQPLENPATGLRPRVLQAVSRELEVKHGSLWSFAVGLAAAAVIVLNLALGSASVTKLTSRPRVSPERVQATARAIDDLHLDLSPQETRQMALRLVAGENLPRLPVPQPALNNLISPL